MHLSAPAWKLPVPDVLLAACAALALCSCGGSSPSDPPLGTDEFTACKEMALSALCADIRNRLFLIDRQVVFWERQGNCTDAGYAWILMESCPTGWLCSDRETIAGPIRGCDEEAYRSMFDIITSNLDEPDLGLGPDHDVEEIPL